MLRRFRRYVTHRGASCRVFPYACQAGPHPAARQRNAPLVERLVQRAQAAGQLRADIRQTDIIFIVFVLIEATQLSRAADPDIWRRYLTLILDGMRPGREGNTPLPVPAMLPEEMEKSMRQAAPWQR